MASLRRAALMGAFSIKAAQSFALRVAAMLFGRRFK